MRDIHDIVDDIFKVLETMRTLFRNWTKEGPNSFMEEVTKLRTLEHELEQVVGDDKKAHMIIRSIYLSTFPRESQTQHHSRYT